MLLTCVDQHSKFPHRRDRSARCCHVVQGVAKKDVQEAWDEMQNVLLEMNQPIIEKETQKIKREQAELTKSGGCVIS